jgi:hypothetical protein
MNRSAKIFVVGLLWLVGCVAVPAELLFLQIRGGLDLFGYTVATYVPVGAMIAGLVATLAYYIGSLAMRVRPAKMMLVAILTVSAGTVYVLDSVGYGLMRVDRASLADTGTLEQFLGTSLANSPLRIGVAASSSADAAGSSSGASAAATPAGVAQTASDSNANVQEIGSGVSTAVTSSQSMVPSSNGNPLGGVQSRVAGMQAYGSSLLEHSVVVEQAGLQMAGFLLAGLLAFTHLRIRSDRDPDKPFFLK